MPENPRRSQQRFLDDTAGPQARNNRRAVSRQEAGDRFRLRLGYAEHAQEVEHREDCVAQASGRAEPRVCVHVLPPGRPREGSPFLEDWPCDGARARRQPRLSGNFGNAEQARPYTHETFVLGQHYFGLKPGVHIHQVRHVIRDRRQAFLSPGPQGWCSLRVAAMRQDLGQPEQACAWRAQPLPSFAQHCV